MHIYLFTLSNPNQMFVFFCQGKSMGVEGEGVIRVLKGDYN